VQEKTGLETNGCHTKQTSALIPTAHQGGDANSFSNLKFTKLKLCSVFKLGFSGLLHHAG